MKNYLLLFCFLVPMGNANALSGFSDYYSTSNWSQLIDGGSIDLSLAPTSISLTSSDDGSFEPNKYQEFTIPAIASGIISFDWAYQTLDTDGPTNDDFGWVLNGAFTKLSNSDGSAIQNGSFLANVNSGDIFGFRAYSFDSFGGAATTTISSFTAPVPLPTAAWLFGSGLFGFLWQAKRKNKAMG